MESIEIGVVNQPTGFVKSLQERGHEHVSFPLIRNVYFGPGIDQREYSAWRGLSPVELQSQHDVVKKQLSLQSLLSSARCSQINSLQDEVMKLKKQQKLNKLKMDTGRLHFQNEILKRKQIYEEQAQINARQTLLINQLSEQVNELTRGVIAVAEVSGAEVSDQVMVKYISEVLTPPPAALDDDDEEEIHVLPVRFAQEMSPMVVYSHGLGTDLSKTPKVEKTSTKAETEVSKEPKQTKKGGVTPPGLATPASFAVDVPNTSPRDMTASHDYACADLAMEVEEEHAEEGEGEDKFVDSLEASLSNSICAAVESKVQESESPRAVSSPSPVLLVPVAPVEDQLVVEGSATRWHRELQMLMEMGFEDVSVLVPLLEQHVRVPAADRAESGVDAQGLHAVLAVLLN